VYSPSTGNILSIILVISFSTSSYFFETRHAIPIKNPNPMVKDFGFLALDENVAIHVCSKWFYKRLLVVLARSTF